MNKQEKLRTAIILCGGRGTRLGILSKKNPKTLVKIQNKEILWYIINILRKNKFNHFILPLGYRGEQIKKFVEKKFKNKINVRTVNTGINSSISSRIHKVKKYIESDNFLLLNGDSIFDFDLNKIYKKHEKNKYKMTFISSSYSANFGTIGIQNKKVISFQRNFTFDYVKSRDKKNLIAHIYSGISIMNITTLNKNFKKYKNFEKKLYPWIIKKFKCNVENLDGFFHAIDNQKDIYTANSLNSEDSKYLKIRKLINSITNKNV